MWEFLKVEPGTADDLGVGCERRQSKVTLRWRRQCVDRVLGGRSGVQFWIC